MLRLSIKGALLCAILPIGALLSGCGGGLGHEGYNEVVAGNWPAAREDFTTDYKNNSGDPLAVFNMGATEQHFDAPDRATTLYAEAVVRGKDRFADNTLEPDGTKASISQWSCSRLHRMNRLDVNCGDSIVARVEAPVAMAAQATVEREAPMEEIPKQARH